MMQFNFGWIIKGTNGHDTLSGSPFSDILYGYDGTDIFNASRGADHYDGGKGFDTIDYSQSTQAVDIDLNKGRGKGGLAQGDSYVDIEGILGTSYDDDIRGSRADELLIGGKGDDVLDGRGGSDELHGGDGNDRLWGGEGHDWLIGDEGDDQAYGGAGDDAISGDGGDDRIFGGDGDDELQGGEGADVIDGGDGVDTAYYSGTVAIDLAAGTASGADASGDRLQNVENLNVAGDGSILFGDNGANHFLIRGEGLQVDGRAGDDLISSFPFGNDIEGGAGNDTVEYGSAFSCGTSQRPGVLVDLDAGTAQLIANPAAPADMLSGIENVIGGNYEDRLFGDGGDNLLNGGGGRDLLNGRGGDDILVGGGEADIFQFVNGRFDNDDDVVADFEIGVDKIDFSDSGNAIDDFDEFLDDSTQVGADVVIDTGRGTITLQSVQLTDFSESDFLF